MKPTFLNTWEKKKPPRWSRDSRAYLVEETSP